MGKKRIGILSSGGDAPGINAVIRAIGKTGIASYDWEILGFQDGFTGITEREYDVLGSGDLSSLLSRGGTILGSSRDKAFRKALQKGDDTAKELEKAWKELDLEAIVCIGGNGTQKTAATVASLGYNVIGIPKTIDNDVWGTDETFGFDTAVSVATELIDRIHSTAQSHKRVILVEVMGHEAGWIALHSGMASGADVILLPELGCDPELVAKAVKKRYEDGKNYAIIVVAEGLRMEGQDAEGGEGPSAFLQKWLLEHEGIDCRTTVLGYVQRGGAPSSHDRNLCTRMGAYAAHLIHDGIFGVMVTLRNGKMTHIPLSETNGKLKVVKPADELIHYGRQMDVSFGVDFSKIRTKLDD